MCVRLGQLSCFWADKSERSPDHRRHLPGAGNNVRHLSLQAGSLAGLALDQWQELLHKYRNLRTLLLFGRFEGDQFFSLLDGVLRNSPGLRLSACWTCHTWRLERTGGRRRLTPA